MTGPLIVFLLHNILLLFLWNQSRKNNDFINKRNYRCLFVVYIVLAVVGLQSGDYIHHIEDIEYVYNEMRLSRSLNDSMMFFHMEPIYNYLAYWLKGNYFLWRMVVFGITYVILFYTVKKLSINYWKYFLLFTLISFSGFIVGRMYWGVALFFCAIACARKTSNFWYLILAVVAMVGHKCLYILPAFIPFVFLKMNKKTVVISGLLLVGMTVVLHNLFGYLSFFSDYDEQFSRNLNYYEETSGMKMAIFGQSTGEQIIYFTRFLAMLIITVSIINKTLSKKVVLPNYVQSLLVLGFLILLLAFAFSLVGMPGIYTWRYITISWFPMTFVIFYFNKNKLLSQQLWDLFMTLMFISFETSLTVPIFYASVRGV